MSSRERMAAAMRLRQPDRVPLMCQLSLGHYFLHSGLDPVDVWHDTEAFAEALLRLRERYGFDGILVNLPGRDPEWRRQVRAVERREGETRVRWTSGWVTTVPADDNPQLSPPADAGAAPPTLDGVDPERLHYVEPHDLSGVSHPYRWGFAAEPAPKEDFFPPWHWDTLRVVRERAPEVSVHGEVFSPFTQLLELLGYDGALLGLIDDPGKVKACLEALCEGTIELMRGHARAGADAVLVSSAFSGGGLISREHYREFVLPCERRVVSGFREAFPDVPVYTHVCGAIGDRLELIAETGTGGIDTLDPPPLGNVELADAVRRVGGRLFIKGNVDPVNTLLRGTPEEVRRDAVERIRVARGGGGYILSSACSVSPHTPPANLAALREAVELAGEYGSAER